MFNCDIWKSLCVVCKVQLENALNMPYDINAIIIFHFHFIMIKFLRLTWFCNHINHHSIYLNTIRHTRYILVAQIYYLCWKDRKYLYVFHVGSQNIHISSDILTYCIRLSTNWNGKWMKRFLDKSISTIFLHLKTRWVAAQFTWNI